MSDKVKLPREVAEAIEEIKERHKVGFIYDLDGIGKAYQENGGPYGVVLHYATFSRERMVEYFNALVNGYEVERTPEDKVREYYNEIGTWTGDYDGSDIQEVIRKVLDDLNIKIQGVNAK